MTNAEPVEIFKNPFDELRPAAARVEILDPQEEFSPACPGMSMAKHCRKGMAKVKPT